MMLCQLLRWKYLQVRCSYYLAPTKTNIGNELVLNNFLGERWAILQPPNTDDSTYQTVRML